MTLKAIFYVWAKKSNKKASKGLVSLNSEFLFYLRLFLLKYKAGGASHVLFYMFMIIISAERKIFWNLENVCDFFLLKVGYIRGFFPMILS